MHHTIGGRAYPVRHYPIAIRLRDRNLTPHQFTKLVGDPVGRAILCIALIPQSGDSSGAILEVPSEALLHPEATAVLCSPFAIKSHLKVDFRAILLQMCIFCCTFASRLQYYSPLLKSIDTFY